MRVLKIIGGACALALVVLLAIPVLSYLGLDPLGPSASEIAALEERWQELTERVGPISIEPDSELERLYSGHPDIASGGSRTTILSNLTPSQQEWLDDCRSWFDASPLPPIRYGDGARVLMIANFALSVSPPLDLPIAKLFDVSNRLMDEGTEGDALAGIYLATLLFDFIAEQNLPSDLAQSAIQPAPTQLALSLIRGAIVTERFYEESSPFQEASGSKRANSFIRFTCKQAAVNFAQSVWEAKASYALLEGLPVVEKPNQWNQHLKSAFSCPAPSVQMFHAIASERTARILPEWKDQLVRWEAAKLAISAN
jgi:hypothetical protein